MGVPVNIYTKIMTTICNAMGWELISQKAHDLLILFAEEMIVVNKKEDK